MPDDAELGGKLNTILAVAQRVGPMLGLKPDEVRPMWVAISNRLKDAKALVHGGQLADGTVVPGVKQVWAAIEELRAGQARIVEAIDAEFRVAPSSSDKPAVPAKARKPAKGARK